MRRLIPVLALLVLALPARAQAQGVPAESERRSQMDARRDSLERVVVQKFVERLERELRLDGEQRTAIERVLMASGLRRRQLMRESAMLRIGIGRAARNSATSDAEFTRLLNDHEALRTREHELWTREQEELSRILNPRQRAQFILAWAHFQDEMRDIMSRRMREQGTPRNGRSGG
jgi:hypothetical protein